MQQEYISYLAKIIGAETAKQIDELAAAFFMKTKVDPRKCILIQHTDYATGKVYSYFEKKRGRSRKQILDNVKSLN